MKKILLILLLGFALTGCKKPDDKQVLKNVEFKINSSARIKSYFITHNGKTVEYTDLTWKSDDGLSVIRYNYFGKVDVAVGEKLEFVVKDEYVNTDVLITMQKQEVGCVQYGLSKDCHFVFMIK